jgi:L-2-hydroxyglutarate oxidase LhgO
MERMNALVIGAGVVGLAVTRELSLIMEDVVLVDREATFGRQTSSRNSEVIHSGIYYPQNSLKASLCVEGNRLLYDFAREHGIPHANCGKLVVATSPEELSEAEKLMANGLRNGVEGLTLLSPTEVHGRIPEVKSHGALWVPSTGIIDTHKFMKKLSEISEDNDAFLVYDMEANRVEKLVDGYRVGFANGEEFETRLLVNCAGLYSEEINRLAGLDTTALGLRMHWCKAEYYKTTRYQGFPHLVYPLPDPNGTHLGIHLTINLAGEIRFGPSAYYVDHIDYKMDESARDTFCEAISRYLDVTPDDLHPDDTGMRPKLQGPGEGFRDFVIREESANGLPGFVNLTGIESPGLTGALAIGKMVREIAESIGS